MRDSASHMETSIRDFFSITMGHTMGHTMCTRLHVHAHTSLHTQERQHVGVFSLPSPTSTILPTTTTGPDVGGPHGPYRQSERKALYKEYVDQLVREGLAYPCFCTDEELEQCVCASSLGASCAFADVFAVCCGVHTLCMLRFLCRTGVTPRMKAEAAEKKLPPIYRYVHCCGPVLAFPAVLRYGHQCSQRSVANALCTGANGRQPLLRRCKRPWTRARPTAIASVYPRTR